MQSTINKINSKIFDSQVHDEFIKFGKGVFNYRYLIEAKKQKDRWSIKSGAEFANFFVRTGLERAKGALDIKGAIISTFPIDKEVKFDIEKVKQFAGVKQVVINSKIDPKLIIEVMNKYPKAFFALTFNVEGYELKVKAKAPKSAKPSASGEKEPVPDFCSLKTNDNNIIKDLFFDGTGDLIKIKNTIVVEEIKIPKGIENPVEMREKSVRKGKIIRTINLDGKEVVRELVFEA